MRMMTSHDGIVKLLMLLISFPLSLANKSLYSKMCSLFSADEFSSRMEGGGWRVSPLLSYYYYYLG
jgi:hypothetical protein